MREEIKNVIPKIGDAQEEFPGKQEKGLENPAEVAAQLMESVGSKIDYYNKEGQTARKAIEENSGLSPEEIKAVAVETGLEAKLRANGNGFKTLGRGVLISLMSILAVVGALKPKDVLAAGNSKGNITDAQGEKVGLSGDKISMAEIDEEVERISRKQEGAEEQRCEQSVAEFMQAMEDTRRELNLERFIVKDEAMKEAIRRIHRGDPLYEAIDKMNRLDDEEKDKALQLIADGMKVDKKYVKAALRVAFNYLFDSNKKESMTNPTVESFDTKSDEGVFSINIIDKKF